MRIRAYLGSILGRVDQNLHIHSFHLLEIFDLLNLSTFTDTDRQGRFLTPPSVDPSTHIREFGGSLDTHWVLPTCQVPACVFPALNFKTGDLTKCHRRYPVSTLSNLFVFVIRREMIAMVYFKLRTSKPATLLRVHF